MKGILTAKGQITIPKSVRKALELEPGDTLEFLLIEDGSIEIRPLTSITELKGMMPKSKKPVSLADMEEAILEGACS